MYFSQIKRSKLEPQQELGRDFFKAITAYFDALVQKSYFTESFNRQCGFGGMFFDSNGFQQTLQREIGDIYWPLPEILISKDNEKILDAIQFSYQHLSKPDASYHCDSCNESHAQTFDKISAQKEYLEQVNRMFKVFNHPYELLSEGKIILKSSAILDEWVSEFDFKSDDEVLLQRIKSALESFYDKSGTKKIDALRSIVDAFERLKTLEGKDKAASVKKVIEAISPDSKVQEYYDALFRNLTDLSNRQTIRHSEKDKVPLDPKEDQDIIEFLFYTFFAAVRLILTRYGFTKSEESGRSEPPT